jgi:hypothetical protein
MTERNADPETVSLAILDACERAARDLPTTYNNPLDKDAQFMAGAVENWQTRIKVLKLQAAAGWQPRFQQMLDQAHSICIEEISYPEKEAVRTKKMRCMACGRWEMRCKFGLNAAGPFRPLDFNSKGAENLKSAWGEFWASYECNLTEKPDDGQLLQQDMGLYSIGETCMRKAQVYYQINTLILNEVFEAYYAAENGQPEDGEWVHATEEQASEFLERFQSLQACAADDKRAVPSWGTDRLLWKKVDEARRSAAQGNEDLLAKMLRTRAESFIGVCHDAEDSGSDAELEIRPAKTNRKRAATLEDSESESESLSDFIVEDDAEEEEERPTRKPAKKPAKKPARKPARKPRAGVRKSRRVMGKAPQSPQSPDEADDAGGPCEEGVPGPPERVQPPRPPDPLPSRAPPPDPFRLAQARRAPEGRLPARRECLLQLGELQMQLIREGRDGEASVCTNAIMTLQELMARVEQLAHTA